jgi:hypothetical protein
MHACCDRRRMQEACNSCGCLQLATCRPKAVESTVHCKQLTMELCMQGGKSPAIVWKVRKLRPACLFQMTMLPLCSSCRCQSGLSSCQCPVDAVTDL